jgi:CheY-like chemotaxis protein
VHGADALARVAEAAPDLVLADLMMPVLGGAELCRRLKADPATEAIPVVLMSAVRPGVGVAAGQAAFLAKPFDLDAVEAIVARSLASATSSGARG